MQKNDPNIRATMARLAEMAPVPVIPSIRTMIDDIADGKNVAKRMSEAIVDDIVAFERKLNPTEEVGARLVGTPDGSVFHLEGIAWRTWEMIGFTGRTIEGNPVQVLQHVSQVSVMLVALPAQEKQAKRIGFVLRQQTHASDE